MAERVTEWKEFTEIPEPPEQLVTEHLVLKPLGYNDAAEIIKHPKEAEAAGISTESLKTVDDMKRAIEMLVWQMKYNAKKFPFSIRDKEGQFVGQASLSGSMLGPKCIPEISIWIVEEMQRQGYGEEAVRAVTEWALQTFHVEYFLCRTEDTNEAGNAHLQKIGAAHHGADYRARDHAFNQITLNEYRIYPQDLEQENTKRTSSINNQ